MVPEEALADEARWFAKALRSSPQRDVTADTIQGRALSYRPKVQRDYQCPKCWIKDGVRSALRSVPGTDEYDLLRCNYDACGAEYVIPF